MRHDQPIAHDTNNELVTAALLGHIVFNTTKALLACASQTFLDENETIPTKDDGLIFETRIETHLANELWRRMDTAPWFGD